MRREEQSHMTVIESLSNRTFEATYNKNEGTLTVRYKKFGGDEVFLLLEKVGGWISTTILLTEDYRVVPMDVADALQAYLTVYLTDIEDFFERKDDLF